MVTQTKKRTHDQLNEESLAPELNRIVILSHLARVTNEESIKKACAPEVPTKIQVRRKGQVSAILEFSTAEAADKVIAALDNKELDRKTITATHPTRFESNDPSDTLLFVLPSTSVPTEEQVKAAFKGVTRVSTTPSLWGNRTNLYVQFESVDKAQSNQKAYSGSVNGVKTLCCTYTKVKAPREKKTPTNGTTKETPAKKQKTETPKTAAKSETPKKTETANKKAETPKAEAKKAETPKKKTETPKKSPAKPAPKKATPAKN